MADRVKDPVCGMGIRPQDAVAREEYDGQMFYFCSRGCHDTFLRDPHRYGHPTEERAARDGVPHAAENRACAAPAPTAQ